MKLGEMLVRDGRLTEEQLVQVLAHQGKGGGRFGTVLVELGLIDLDALTVYLGLELGIPIATGAMLERAKRSAVRLLSPEQAFRHKCVPLIVQDRQLIAAVEDPHAFDNLDALTRLTGYRVIPRIAPEIRIYYYVERYYGIPRPARFLVFADTPRGDQPVDEALPAPPLPGLPPVALTPVVAPTPPPALRRLGTSGEARADADAYESYETKSEALELDAEDLLEELDSDEAARAEAAPVAPARPAGPTNSTVELPALRPAYTPLDADAAVQSMAEASERGQVADAIMAFAAHLFDGATLFIVKDNLALGWKGAGDLPGKDRVDCLLIPLDAVSMFQVAVKSEDAFFHGALTPSTVHSYFYKVLRTQEPAMATVAVVAIGRREVNMLYGHRRTRPELTTAEVDAVRRVCRAAAEAYARLIAVHKRSQTMPPPM
jgi:hypothetical protein